MNEIPTIEAPPKLKCWCGDPIEAHKCFDGVSDGVYWSIMVCVNCQEIRDLIAVAVHTPRRLRPFKEEVEVNDGY